MWFGTNKKFENELYLKKMNKHINEHEKGKEIIKFQKKQIDGQKFRKLKEMQKNYRLKQKENLEGRRKKLKMKLERERQNFELELGQKGKIASGERKEKLKARVAELRKKNEEEKERLNKKVEQERFENGADELREIERRV